MGIEWQRHITSDPSVLRGRPRLEGTRIPVSLVLGYLAGGRNIPPSSSWGRAAIH